MLFQNLSPELRTIAEKVANGTRITPEEGVLLFEQGSLSFVGALANTVRERKNGDKVFFNRNFHIEPTNVCIYTCDFCSYSRRINVQHRLVYEVFKKERTVRVLRMWTHYE